MKTKKEIPITQEQNLRLPTVLEETILTVLGTGSSHGWDIVKSVNAAIASFNKDLKINKEYSFGSIYPTLRRMEKKLCWLESEVVDNQGDEAKIVKRKKNYRLTRDGIIALEMIKKYRQSIDNFGKNQEDTQDKESLIPALSI